MRLIPLALLAASLLAPLARADKFLLGPAEAHPVEGSVPDMVVGVILAESDTHYHLRVVGGELMLPKKLVRKVEKDGLTVEAIVKQEADRVQALAKANAERRAQQAEAAAAVAAARAPKDRCLTGDVADAGFRRSGDRPAEPVFDPVVGAIPPTSALSDRELLREMELAYELTGDQRYIKLVRKLRRLR